MKQIIAILIAFFVCAGATQVYAQQTLNLTTITLTKEYVVQPTDETVMITGYAVKGVVKLPDPTTCKGRLIRILNRNDTPITVIPYFTGVLYPTTEMLIRTTTSWVSDGKAWYLFSKSW